MYSGYRSKLSEALGLVLLIAFRAAPGVAECKRTESLTPSSRETMTCGEREAALFCSWATMASLFFSEEKLKKRYPGAEIVAIEMPDNRQIRGLHFPSEGSPRGAVLVIPGNGWAADDFAKFATDFYSRSLDVYVFDYRGYALSFPGIPTMSAIMADFKNIGEWLVAKRYSDLYLYAFSFGGVVALNAFPGGAPFSRVVLDAVPSRPSEIVNLSCTPSYDPVDRLPERCDSITIMHGTKDRVLPRHYTQELIDDIARCGGKTDVSSKRGHPFQWEFRSTSQSRLSDVLGHFGIGDSR